MTALDPPSRPPSLDDSNSWADFWYYRIGVNVIPANTRIKTPFVEWKRWQTEPIPEELHEQWKDSNAFANGIAIILGKVWRGEHEGKYFIFIDCDNSKAIEEFCNRDGKTVSLKEIGEKFLVEQHKDNTNKCHIFFYSEIPFVKKSSDINVVGATAVESEEIPAFEIKGNSAHGIAYCTPSIHKNGRNYEILGTTEPISLGSKPATEMMRHLDNICKKYGLQYLENSDGNGKSLIPMSELAKDEIHEGHNRHEALLRIMESLIRRNYDIFEDPEPIKQLAYQWNQEHCVPPLNDREFEKQWRDASRYIRRKLADNNNSGGVAAASARVDGKMLIEEMKENDPNTKIKNYLTEEVIKRISLRTLLDTGEILYYDSKEKVWRFNGERMIDVEIEKIAEGPVVTNHMKKEVQKHIMDNRTLIVPRSAFDANFDIINLENCRLNIITEKQLPQTPEENLTLSKFPMVYDPYAECPNIEKFLSDVIIEPHKLKEVLKFWGYILLKDCRFEKALMLLGGGSNGKSVLIKLLETAVGGDENCSHGSLHEFEEDKFVRAGLFSKILNTYADLKSTRLKETGNIKTLISGDSIEAQHKFKPRFKFQNKAKIVVSTNNPPETEDKTHAFYRRWLIVTFDRTFAKSEDPNDVNKKGTNLLSKLTTPEELSGFLNLGLKYLQVLLRENGFAEEPIDKVKHEYEFKADHIARYLQDCCVIDYHKTGHMTKTETLYNHYLKWCAERDRIIPLDENVFGSKLTEHGIQRKRKRIADQGQPYFYMPIVLRHTLEEGKGQEDISSSLLTSSDNVVTTKEEEALIECPYCSLDNIAGNSPLFVSKSLRDVQVHLIFRHPYRDFEEVVRVGIV